MSHPHPHPRKPGEASPPSPETVALTNALGYQYSMLQELRSLVTLLLEQQRRMYTELVRLRRQPATHPRFLYNPQAPPFYPPPPYTARQPSREESKSPP